MRITQIVVKEGDQSSILGRGHSGRGWLRDDRTKRVEKGHRRKIKVEIQSGENVKVVQRGKHEVLVMQ